MFFYSNVCPNVGRVPKAHLLALASSGTLRLNRARQASNGARMCSVTKLPVLQIVCSVKVSSFIALHVLCLFTYYGSLCIQDTHMLHISSLASLELRDNVTPAIEKHYPVVKLSQTPASFS